MTITIGRGPLRLGGGIVIGQQGVQLAGGGASQPYDNTPSIAAAYGMRRLLTSYTSNLLRLRRSSDNAESDFGYVANGDLDTAAIATWLGANSGYVVTWYDQSGNGDNATQATAASQPLYTSSGLTFDGTNDHLLTAIVPASGWSMAVSFASFSSNASTLTALAGSRNTTNNRRFYVGTNTTASNQIVYGSGSSLGVAPHLASGVLTVAGQQGYRDGVADGSAIGAWTVPNNALAIYIGGYNNDGSPLGYASATINEMVISSATYTAQQVAAITDIMEAA